MRHITRDYLKSCQGKLQHLQASTNSNQFSGSEMTQISVAILMLTELEKIFSIIKCDETEIPFNWVQKIQTALAIEPAKRAITPREALAQIAERDKEIARLKSILARQGIIEI